MAAEVTTMVLKVDLQCHKCYKKVKKVLSKFPQIRDQVYDEKQNTVTIKVVYCCPEILMAKISSKGGKSINSIEIKPPSKPKEPEKKTEAEKPKEKPEAEKPKQKPEDPKPTKPKVVIIEPPKPQPAKATEAAPPTPKALVTAPTPEAIVVAPIPQAPEPAPGYPFGVYYNEYYGGPFQRLGYERLVSYDGYYGRPVYDSWGGSGGGWSRGNYSGRGDYFPEENPSTCSIM
ncbi:protein PYRICULARIA ORYZAE RESISTANCE 21-like [Mangifera indica]|uniref:protein PYRICULARIA ORYZAE RESISTANCE 21-like n=1 Tax=Mangifera indica TaxID=29780 RepID=UPI001CFB43DB|nr:protein PYRICULARIA ORYZAE RESISTANCE 21-like [Mangifera indica]